MTVSPPRGDPLLVRAVLASGNSAVEAGRAWLEQVELAHLGPDEQRMLPLLYKSLTDAGCADLPALLKGVYRHSWARNNVRARQVVDVVRALRSGDVPSIVLKGMALVDYYGDRWGARDMCDADLLVRAEDARHAIDVLVATGWAPRAGATATTLRQRLIDHRSGWPFVGPGDVELDLHWHWFHTSLGERADDDLWAAAEDFLLHGVPVRRPHPADLVLHACEQGSVDAGAARLVCTADVVTITRRVGADVIGPRLAEQARRHSLVARTRAFLEIVAECSRAPEVLALAHRLDGTPLPRLERALVRASDRPDTRRADLLSSVRRQGGGRTGLWAAARGVLRERVEPALARRPVSAALYALSGRPAWIGRALRRLRGSWTAPPAGSPPPLTSGQWIDFTDAASVDRFGGPGWSSSEPEGTWTDGAEARLVLPIAVPDRAGLLVTLDAMPFCVEASPQRTVELRANERTIARLHFDGPTFVPGSITVRVDHAVARLATPLELAFLVRRPVVPATLGLSSDGRRVGLRVRRLRVDLTD